MRGTRFRMTIGAVLAAALLGACTSNGSTASSATSPTPAIGAAVTSAAPATSAQVTVPPVSSSAASTPASPAAPSSSGTSTSGAKTTSAPVKTAATLSPTKSSTTSKPPVVPATVTVSPQPGNATLSPRTPIVVKAAHGTLDGVQLVNADGAPVKGALNAARTTWTLAEPLGYDASYRLRGRAVAANGKATAISGEYQTINPDGLIGASISPENGRTVGIAAPILISLGSDIDDTTGRQNIERAITITTVPKTEGSFAWIQHDDGWGLDWRPKNYWAPW
jgi:hypothetical protein